MVLSGYAKIAKNRQRELTTRCGMAAFIAVSSLFLAPSVWPLIWFLAVIVTQALDGLVFRPLRRRPDMHVSLAYQVGCCAMSAVNVIVYSGIAAYLWFYGGEAGRLFGIIQIAGGLLHVSLHMHQVRPLLLSAVIPHASYFLGLPAISAFQNGRPIEAVIIVGGCLYMTHLVVSVRQSSAATRALEAATEEAETQRRQAEIANAAKSDFLAVISHEIRTPMNAVLSAANLLKRTRLDSEQDEHVSMLADAGEVMIGLLNDVLDFSKIEAGKMTLESTAMDLRDKLEALHKLWDHRATASGVELRLTIADDVPGRVQTDPLRLQQILFNLLSNAIKFTDRGAIRITASWSRARNELTVAVADSGCGIAPEPLARVFESFEQADASTTRRFGGTGLGLSISRRLAQMMGGTLSAESAIGQGSTFTLVIPVVPLPDVVEMQTTQSEPTISLQGRVILVAEDHAVNRRILQPLLEPHGCRLVMVENGLEAVELARTQSFDAILMDMQMPVMDGLEAAGAIRSAGANVNTPVVALTANAMDIHRAAWEAVGVFAFLTKPIDPVLLAHTVADACDSDGSAAVRAAA